MDIKSEVLPKSCWLLWGQAWVQPRIKEDPTPRISPVTSCLFKVGYGFGVTCECQLVSKMGIHQDLKE